MLRCTKCGKELEFSHDDMCSSCRVFFAWKYPKKAGLDLFPDPYENYEDVFGTL